MVSLTDAAAVQNGPLAATLGSGLAAISDGATVTFTQYVLLILPMDGFKFWVNEALVGINQSAVINGPKLALNTSPLNAHLNTAGPQVVEIEPGSLHFSTAKHQDQDGVFTLSKVRFATTRSIEFLNAVAPNTLWIGTFNGQRFAFREQNAFYQQAGLYHYEGDAVYPQIETQIIDSPAQIDTMNRVITNSLPLFLSLNAYAPVYPSYAIPENTAAPYVAVHVYPDSTRAIMAAPFIDGNTGYHQLCAERVKLTAYGLRNFKAFDYSEYLMQASLNADLFGVMNMPVWRDEKETQPEISVLAMKKSMEIEVSYYQSRANNVARQLISSAIPSFAYAQ